jgi:hypothetical protein
MGDLRSRCEKGISPQTWPRDARLDIHLALPPNLISEDDADDTGDMSVADVIAGLQCAVESRPTGFTR